MLVATVGAAVAQEPPTPPARPAPVARPVPAPRARTPLPPIDIDEARIRSEVDRAAREVERASREFDRIDLDAVREQSARIAEAAREAARDFSRDFNRDFSRDLNREALAASREMVEAAREDARRLGDSFREFTPLAPMPAMAPMAPMAAMPAFPPMPAMAPMAFGRAGDGFYVPLPQWIQGDPADSVYRVANDVLNRGDYGRAAQMFKDIAQKYPKSGYQDDLPYYEAFARYKIGTTNELQTAAKLLEPRASKLIGTTSPSNSSENRFFVGKSRRSSDGDVVGLYVHINSVLAQRGDANAIGIVTKATQAGANTCDNDDIIVRREAMGALSQMEAATALPIIKRVLDKKDECTVELRSQAVSILGRRGDADAATLIAATAKSDPSASVRVQAISWLPKLQGDAGVNMLEEILRTEQDERIQRAVVRTLTSSDNPKARSSMRALIDRKDAPINLRIEAVSSFSNDRATTEDAAYLRGLYARADNDRLKEAILNALGRIGGQENDQWILSIAKNQNEPSQLRGTAISRLMRANLPIADLVKLYDAADSYEVRSRIVSALENRKEPEASDKLVDIIRNSTVVNIRTQALTALMRKKDPRSEKIVQDILDGKKP
jgi:HEAT repeat protein/TolA-binding protein